MTPAARIAAAAGVLDQVLAGTPAEKALTGWARGARYAGSGDRAAVRDHVFQALRCRRSYACLGGGQSGRALMIGAQRATGRDPDAVFTGVGHAPAPLTPLERAAGRAPAAEGERMDLPDWLVPAFRAALGDRAEQQAAALQGRAPVMLRVNSRRAGMDAARATLRAEGIETEPHPVAATALRVTAGSRRVSGSRAYRSGLVEVQDGSSQAAMETVTARKGARILDFCAGGGGKTLALGGRIDAAFHAHDADPRRMTDLPGRATRAGLAVTVLAPGDAAGHAPYDVVICDVPCSGSGTWRRTPDAKWRLAPDALAHLCRTQDDILDAAWGLCRAGGTLVYVTCSLLEVENEERVAAFRTRHPGAAVRLQRRWPVTEGGDGFFVAHIATM